MAEMGQFKPDALNESIGLELDMLNILYVISPSPGFMYF